MNTPEGSKDYWHDVRRYNQQIIDGSVHIVRVPILRTEMADREWESGIDDPMRTKARLAATTMVRIISKRPTLQISQLAFSPLEPADGGLVMTNRFVARIDEGNESMSVYTNARVQGEDVGGGAESDVLKSVELQRETGMSVPTPEEYELFLDQLVRGASGEFDLPMSR